VGKSI